MSRGDLSQKLPVAETFYSIQGEGPRMGTPSIFLRLSHCNLRCPSWGANGCDTTDVWSKVWQHMTPEEILAHWGREGWLEHLVEGEAHLIVTGGEPLLWQSRLIPLLATRKHWDCFIEVETNATLKPSIEFDALVDQYNCSPKLASAGNPMDKAYVPIALEFFASIRNRASFKFVVVSEEDVEEIFLNYIIAFNLWPGSIYLMPQASTREELIRNSQLVAELCKEYGFRFSSRLQLLLWDRATGV